MLMAAQRAAPSQRGFIAPAVSPRVPVLPVIGLSRRLTLFERRAKADLVEIFAAVWGPLLFPSPVVPRACPEDFDAAYIEHGFDECELIFAAGAETVRRWLHERGAERLRQARSARLREKRATEKARLRKPARHVKPAFDGIAVDPEVLAAAAHFLRTMRYGGHFVAQTGDGDWWFNTTRVTPAQVVAKAEAKGFDAEGAKRTGDMPGRVG